jgi:hypothetical protein
MLQDFQNLFVYSLTTGQIILNITVALFCSFMITVFYRITNRSMGYSPSFLKSLIVLSLITCVVIMIIGNNLARAFGLVGAMSIIRFRTAVKETLDIVYIFFALVVGMAGGVGLFGLAIISTFVIGFVLIFLSKGGFISYNKQDFLLQFVSSTNTPNGLNYLPVIEKYCNTLKLVNIKSLDDNDFLELSYYLNLKNSGDDVKLVNELKLLNGIGQINLFFDEEIK